MREHIDAVLEKVLITILTVLVMTVLWQVASRYLLASPSTYTDEIAGFLLIWLGVLGAAYVSGKKGHLAIDLALQKLGDMNQLLVKNITQVLIACFGIIVVGGGGAWLVYTRFVLDVRSAALNLNLGFVYMVLPLSGFLIGYYAIAELIELKREKKS